MGGPKTPGNFVQDGPPKGGYPTINVKRNLPGGGMSSLALAGSCVALGAYGLYKVVMANRVRRCVPPSCLQCSPAYNAQSRHVRLKPLPGGG